MIQPKIRGNSLLMMVVIAAVLVTGCRLHSPLQEELAKDVQDRYKLVSPSAVHALEVLDSDLDKLLESERADFEVYRETTENEVINMTWELYRTRVSALKSKYFKDDGSEQGVAAEVKNGIVAEDKAIKTLDTRIEELDKILKSLNKALKKAEEGASTLAADLEDAKTIIAGALSAIQAAINNDPASPLAQRLSSSVGEIDKLIKQLAANKLKREQSEQVFSLVIEAMRLGRDIAALEKEAVEQERSYHERVLALYKAQQKILPLKIELESMQHRFEGKVDENEMVRERLNVLARQISRDEDLASSIEERMADEQRNPAKSEPGASKLEAHSKAKPRANKSSEQKKEAGPHPRDLRKNANDNREVMRQILEDMARLQTLNLTDEMRKNELELRRAAEKFRNAKLKDVIFERQRITLIGYGLDGVVRYAESGLRSEDIASLINITRMVAEFIIAARV